MVIARFGANAYQVITDAKAKLVDLEQGLPPGVFIKTAYDRSALIERSVHTLRHTLIEEMIVVGLVCILFLLHARSELVAIFVVPTSVLTSLLVMHILGINANIMSLGGIAIAVGANRPPGSESHWALPVAALLGCAFIAATIYVVYRFAEPIGRILGDTAMSIFIRLSSFILLCIGVQIISTGLKAYLQALGKF